MGKNKKRNTAARRAQNNKQAVEEPQAPVSAEEVQKPHIPELQVGEIRAADPEPMSSDKATTDIPETPRKIEDTTPDSHETATPGEQNSESDEPDEPVEQQDLGEMTTSTVSEITESTIEEKAVPTEPLEQEEPNTSLAQPQPAETSQQTTSEGPSVVSEPIAPETERAPEPEQHKPQPDTIADVPRSTTTSLPVEHRSSPSEAATEHTEPQQTAKEEEVRLDVSSVTTQPPCEPAAAVASVPELPEAKHEHCVTIGNTRGSLDYSSRSEIIKAVHGTNNAVNGLMDSIVPSARPKKQSRVCCCVQ